MKNEELKQSFCGWIPFLSPTSRNHSVDFIISITTKIPEQGIYVELLYADDLILIAESEESLRDKIVKWKSGLEAKGLKMNTGKTFRSVQL